MEHALTKFRRDRGLSMEAFGKLIGATKSMVSKWENGRSIPRRAAMQKVYEITGGGVVPADFIGISAPELGKVAAE